jgi:predicted extracellular nuclease
LSKGRLLIPTNIYEPGSSQAIALADRNKRNVIVLDDQNNSQNPEFVPFPNSGLSYNNGVRLGDAVDNITGILDYSFSTYRILPTQEPTFLGNNQRQASPTIGSASEVKVASFNVLNYFNGDGQGSGFPTARGADTFEEFTRQSDKIVAALAEINADVVGLMEIENDGFDELSAIADLTDKLNSVVGANTYQYISIDATELGGDAIAVGLLYKPATVSLAGNAVTTNETPFDFGNRQPLVQSFTSNTSGVTFTVAVNHFKSKGSCGSASGGNADQNDGQVCWNELRTQAANKLVSWLNSKPTDADTDNILIIGDLNAYGMEDPIRAITATGYHNLIAEKIGQGAYSYSFGGESGYLDHALASSSLNAFVDSVDEWHINADEPVAFDYNVERKSDNQLATYYGSDAYRASDHDPVIVSFTFNTPEVLIGDFDNDADIDIADIRTFISMLRAGESFDLSYDLNNDGQVSMLDARVLMQSCTRSRCAM